MAKQKKNNQPPRQKQTAYRVKPSQTKAPVKEAKLPRASHSSVVLASLMPVLLFLLTVFITLCLLSESTTGIVGGWVRTGLFGLFSNAAYSVPVMLAIATLFWRRDYAGSAIWQRIFVSVIFAVTLAVLFFSTHMRNAEFDILSFWNKGLALEGGGVLGDMIGWLLVRGIGVVGTMIVTIACLIVFGFLLFGMTPHAVWMWCVYRIRDLKDEWNAERESEREAYEAERSHARKQLEQPSAEKPQKADVPPETDPNAQQRRFRQVDANGKRKAKRIDLSVNNREDDIPVICGTEPDAETDEIPTIRNGAAGQMPSEEDLQAQNREDRREQREERREQRSPFRGEENAENHAEIIDTAVFEELMRRQKEEDAANSAAGLSAGAVSSAIPGHIIENIPSTSASSASPSNDSPISEEVLRRFHEEQKEKGSSDQLRVERGNVVAAPIEPSHPVYKFPPTSLLELGKQPNNTDVTEELQTTARRLVETLNSFKVRTRIVNISRGPAITRYELTPEEGVRVRSILNLVDDISLNLASSGVRIEAPIPGKQAVGVEVPNRVVSIVSLRHMLETPKFAQATSRLNVALGEDVAGEPVYLDISKMPHLLIAGTTGSGKSVCINSMIMSILFKATPDEVRLILIDPKKVEFKPYIGMPHLLVPIVNDPKKAAGSLQWAVGEMERRYVLLEDIGVRDLKSYNKARQSHPEYENLPQIVIFIDELADLMMTASDSVEESICRLAQKARAAGMYLVIGTQRPSVDVVTGLIKANVPSRISCALKSQIDSRTVLDTAGAEKLIGRGDMLYAPLGAVKPVRIQGSYVDESEIDRVLNFIKENYGSGEYDAEIIESIEREAARCGQSKKSAAAAAEGADDGEEDDSMLKPAIELAVESGKISTSLIQRRLSLGYGRAAKLIDRMERMGIVSAPEGQKPRTVLINKQQYMEMMLNSGE